LCSSTTQDLAIADTFFGTTFGLQKTMDLECMKIFRTVAGSSIGCVKEGRGSLKAATDKPVMVSWVVAHIEGWHRRLTASNCQDREAAADELGAADEELPVRGSHWLYLRTR
jgi:hypothetical protein